MRGEFEKLLAQYDYELPPELIAQEPARPRDAARLMVYQRETNTVSLDTFSNLSSYLPPRAVLVFNKTRVIPARLFMRKESGGHVELLYLRSVRDALEMLAHRKLGVGARLLLRSKKIFVVESCSALGIYRIRPQFAIPDIRGFLKRYGHTPIPPYVRHTQLTEAELRRHYQTVFARQSGSVAAPTASLHFMDRSLRQLEDAGYAVRFVTLHVGLGTFAPLREEQVVRARLHEEQYNIDKSTATFLNRAKQEGRPIIAVGTTVLRTLESASDARGVLKKLGGSTDLFIRPPHKFNFINGMITNFHVPKSSLMMLVAALVSREKLFELYAQAIREKFRFFSFGDGMLLL